MSEFATNQKSDRELSNIPQLWREALEYTAKHPRKAKHEINQSEQSNAKGKLNMMMSLICCRPFRK